MMPTPLTVVARRCSPRTRLCSAISLCHSRIPDPSRLLQFPRASCTSLFSAFSTPSPTNLQSTELVNHHAISKSYNQHSRLFSTSPYEDQTNDTIEADQTAEDAVKTKSNRQLFREIPVRPGVLAYIRSVGVGIVPRQRGSSRMNTITDGRRIRGKSRQNYLESVSRKNKQAERPNAPPPLPFGSDAHPVRVVAEIHGPTDHVPRKLDGIPTDMIPQVALCGRSNVGKSTMINALLYGNRAPPTNEIPKEDEQNTKKKKKKRNELIKMPKGVKASVSPRPGETRHITMYQLGAPNPKDESQDMRLLLVDLPGYGFAFANEKTKHDFQTIMVQYLTGIGREDNARPPKRILMLLDARHGMKKGDIDFLGMLQMAILEHKQQAAATNAKVKPHERKRKVQLPPIQLVLTKCDLVSQADLARRIVQVQQQLSDVLVREPSQLPVMLCSAGARMEGILEIQKELAGATVSVEPVAPRKKPTPTPPPQRNLPPKFTGRKPTVETSLKLAKQRHAHGRNGIRSPRRLGMLANGRASVSVEHVAPREKLTPTPPPQRNLPPKFTGRKPTVETSLKLAKQRHAHGRNGIRSPRRSGMLANGRASSGFKKANSRRGEKALSRNRSQR